MPAARRPAEILPPLVLIVEDDPLIAIELEETLKQQGYYVLGPAHSVAAALALLEHADPDVAVLDVNLHGKKITPVAQVLTNRQVPFVLASGSTEPFEDDILAHARNFGKPTHRQALLAEIERLLASGHG